MLCGWSELATRDPETSIAIPVGVGSFEFAGADHDRALELRATITLGERASGGSLSLSGRKLVGELREQLAPTGAYLPLPLARGVPPALHAQVSTCALVPQPLAQAEL
ncbi:hypothetical protein ABW54_33110, partial [Burkholderia cenocepacia]